MLFSANSFISETSFPSQPLSSFATAPGAGSHLRDHALKHLSLLQPAGSHFSKIHSIQRCFQVYMLCFFTISPLFSPPLPFYGQISIVYFWNIGVKWFPILSAFLRLFCIIYFHEINKSPASFFRYIHTYSFIAHYIVR